MVEREKFADIVHTGQIMYVEVIAVLCGSIIIAVSTDTYKRLRSLPELREQDTVEWK